MIVREQIAKNWSPGDSQDNANLKTMEDVSPELIQIKVNVNHCVYQHLINWSQYQIKYMFPFTSLLCPDNTNSYFIIQPFTLISLWDVSIVTFFYLSYIYSSLFILSCYLHCPIIFLIRVSTTCLIIHS